MHELILKEAPARLAGFSVLQFTGSTPPNKRHDVIRSFQEAGGRAQTRGVTGLATISGFRVCLLPQLSCAVRPVVLAPTLPGPLGSGSKWHCPPPSPSLLSARPGPTPATITSAGVACACWGARSTPGTANGFIHLGRRAPQAAPGHADDRQLRHHAHSCQPRVPHGALNRRATPITPIALALTLAPAPVCRPSLV